MNRFFVFLLFTFLSLNALAIEWVELTTPLNKKVFLDKDSIKETDKYYFYNIKHYLTAKNTYLIQTIQSSKFHSFSAVLANYNEDEYIRLNGDYQNIMNNQTNKLMPVIFQSVINTCFMKVSQIKNENNIQIEF